ncbi:MAG: hypothetical protein P1P84_19380 [Deferrisomatales bacterium]|nr:hypothetical protein [Deferrisomatales bacterium]
MPQLHLYVPEDTAGVIRQRAEERGTSVSRYLAEIVRRELTDAWPDGYFRDVVGAWQGGELVRPSQQEFEAREAF